MNKKEYMERLEQLLLVLTEEERTEALQYYQDYFADAGVENEENVIDELGTPEEVAAKIRAGYAGENGEYSEQGFEDVRFHKSNELVAEPESVDGDWEEIPAEESTMGPKEKRSKNTNVWKIIAIIVLLLFASPVIIPLGMVLLVIVFALIVTVVAVLFAVGILGVALLVAGVAVIAAAIARIILAPAAGILAAGIGCILLAVGVVVSWLIISVFIKAVPGIIRGIVKLLGAPFRKAGAK